jgi:hypothetical protein
MSEQYKHIITIREDQVADLQSHARFGVQIRPARNAPGEWVIKGPMHERKLVDKIVKLFDAA